MPHPDIPDVCLKVNSLRSSFQQNKLLERAKHPLVVSAVQLHVRTATVEVEMDPADGESRYWDVSKAYAALVEQQVEDRFKFISEQNC